MVKDIYEQVMTLAKRRGFIYPSYEIYGGVAGFYDYGPLGATLKNNVEQAWRKKYLLQDNCFEITTPTITPFEVLKASGHVDEFTDITVDCSKCKRSFKAEDLLQEGQILEEELTKKSLKCPECKAPLEHPHPVNLMFSTTIGVGKEREAFLRPETAQGIFTNFHLLYRHNREKLPFGVVQVGRGYRNEISPRQGTLRQREFNMAEAEIFIDPQDKTHPNFHHVEEYELLLFDNTKEIKVSAGKAVKQKIIANQALAYYMCVTQELLLSFGIDPKKFRFRKHADDELAHYAQECWDVELYSDHFGWIECVGIADRSAYDINAHIQATGTDMYTKRPFDTPIVVQKQKIIPKMDVLGPLFKGDAGAIKALLEAMEPSEQSQLTLEYKGKTFEIPKESYEIVTVEEKQTGEKLIPHVIEPSYGIDRILYFILEHTFKQVTKKGEQYHLLGLPAHIAPISAGVFPLISDESLVEQAKMIDQELRNHGIPTYYDEGGTIGRRYARMDEVGTPFCITVDHETLETGTVTVRNRDTTKQQRIKNTHLTHYFIQHLVKRG